MATRKKPVAVADLVARFLADRHGHTARPDASIALRVFEAFGRIGPPVTEHAEVAYFRSGVLHLTVGDSAWLTELTFLKKDLLARINLTVGRPLVRDLRLRPGKLSGRRPAMVRTPPELTPAERARVEPWTREIKDEAVREAVTRAAARNLAAARPKEEPYRGPPGPRLAKPDPIADPPAEDRFRFPKDAPVVDRWKNKRRR